MNRIKSDDLVCLSPPQTVLLPSRGFAAHIIFVSKLACFFRVLRMFLVYFYREEDKSEWFNMLFRPPVSKRGAETWGFHESPSYPHMYCFLAWRERIESSHKTHHVGTL